MVCKIRVRLTQNIVGGILAEGRGIGAQFGIFTQLSNSEHRNGCYIGHRNPVCVFFSSVNTLSRLNQVDALMDQRSGSL